MNIDEIEKAYMEWKLQKEPNEAELKLIVDKRLADRIGFQGGYTAQAEKHKAEIAELVSFIRKIMEGHNEDFGMDDYPDDESIGKQEVEKGIYMDVPLTFGTLRKGRKLIAKYKGCEQMKNKVCIWKPDPANIWFTPCGFFPLRRPIGDICPKCKKPIEYDRSYKNLPPMAKERTK